MFCYNPYMTKRNFNLPDTFAQDVVSELNAQAHEQGTTITEQLRKVYEAHISSVAIKEATESGSDSPE